MVIGRKVPGKRGTRYVPLRPAAARLIAEYLEAAGHGGEDGFPLFLPPHNSRDLKSREAMALDAIYRLVRDYTQTAPGETFGAHSMRSTVATNALASGADIAKKGRSA